MGKTFVGIGFGPIQSGLFLLEAHSSGNFQRLVVAEVVPEIVATVRQNGGRIRVNVAHRQGIETLEITGLEIYNPLVAADASRLVEAISTADEVATALPSVDFFCRGNPSPADLLARGIERKLTDRRLPRAVVYSAENHNHSAEKLRHAVFAAFDVVDPTHCNERVEFVNTVIGKMSGVVTNPAQIQRNGLAPFVEGATYAVLVEEFNRILISRITLADLRRGIEVFQEKPDLLPFKEAKLYGHNAAHALLGYIANRAELTLMHEADAQMRQFVEQAFLEESGPALCRRHAGVDPLFTLNGWAEYVRDLLERMTNPYLGDRVDRVIRDSRRKLAWNDRLVGTMRLAIDGGVAPRRYAQGAAAAAEMLLTEHPEQTISSLLKDIWRDDTDSPTQSNSIINFIEKARSNPFSLTGRDLSKENHASRNIVASYDR